MGKKIRGLKAPRLAGPVAQAGSRESSNRLRRFFGSKVGQGPLGGSESISVRSRASLGGGTKKGIRHWIPKTTVPNPGPWASSPPHLGMYLPRGVEVLLVIRDRMVSGESEGLQERAQAGY